VIFKLRREVRVQEINLTVRSVKNSIKRTIEAAVTSRGGHLFSERSRRVLQYSTHGFTLENVLLTGGGIGSLTGPGCMGFTVIIHDGPLSEGLPADDAQIWRNGLNQPVWTYCGGLSIIGNPYPADPLGPNVETNRWVR
jgi:hypothetical protein